MSEQEEAASEEDLEPEEHLCAECRVSLFLEHGAEWPDDKADDLCGQCATERVIKLRADLGRERALREKAEAANALCHGCGSPLAEHGQHGGDGGGCPGGEVLDAAGLYKRWKAAERERETAGSEARDGE